MILTVSPVFIANPGGQLGGVGPDRKRKCRDTWQVSAVKGSFVLFDLSQQRTGEELNHFGQREAA